MTSMESRKITLPKGQELYVDFSEKFEEVVRSHFNLKDGDSLTDRDIRLFIIDSMQAAVVNASSSKNQIRGRGVVPVDR